jgi:hypothetical protein
MTAFPFITRLALLGLLLVLMSCGGGIGGSGSPVVAVGTVTEVGSVVVNGIAFDTAGATITLNGQPGSEADLRLGQVVTVRGTLAPSGVAGTAETVAIENTATGPIESLDLAANSLVVLGQIVRIDATTQFGATPFDELVIGNIVTLSGFVDADGVLRATRVEKTQDRFTDGTVLKTTGAIANLDDANETFTLQMLLVDFSAAQLINVPGDQLRNGQIVDVKSVQNAMDSVLFADSVEVKAVGVRGDPGQAVEFQGIITRVISADTFEVNGQPVRLTPTTVFERGTPADIDVNVSVEVEGFFAADGIIVVEEIELGAGVEFQGIITEVISADTFEVDDRPVRFTPETIFEGGTTADIAVSVPVEVEGFFDTQGVLVATEISFLTDLEGIITAVISADTFEIDGQLVRFTPETVFEGGTAADIAVGVSVEVEGFFDTQGVLIATEIGFLP